MRLAVGLLLLGLLATRVSWRGIAEVVSDAHAPTIILAAVIASIDRVWMASKWLYLARRLGLSATLPTTLRAYFVAGLVIASSQLQVAGDVSRAASLGHKTGNPGASLLSVFLERLTGVIALGMLASMSLLIGERYLALGGWSDGIGLLGAAFLIAFAACTVLLVFVPEHLVRATRRVLFRRSARLGALQSSLEAVPLTGLRRTLLVFYALTLLEQLVPFVQFLVYAHAFHLSVAPMMALCVMPVIAFLSRIPVSVDALGVREGLYVVLFGAAGLSAEGALAVALASRGVDIAVALVGSGLMELAAGFRGRQAVRTSDLEPEGRGAQ